MFTVLALLHKSTILVQGANKVVPSIPAVQRISTSYRVAASKTREMLLFPIRFFSSRFISHFIGLILVGKQGKVASKETLEKEKQNNEGAQIYWVAIVIRISLLKYCFTFTGSFLNKVQVSGTSELFHPEVDFILRLTSEEDNIVTIPLHELFCFKKRSHRL